MAGYLAEKRTGDTVHIYEVTCEPEISWGFKGRNEDLVDLFKIAYPALREADPKALVAGPTIGILAHEQLEALLKLGLGNYIDVLDFHPYIGADTLPEEVDLIGAVRKAKELMIKYIGRELPMIGTEAGNNVTGEGNHQWLRKAWSDIHHNLILLGEGFWFNIGFHGADMGRECGVNTWGYCFNLDTERDYGIRKGSPKPALAAYAAMSWLLEGKRSAGPIEWLGDKVRGYAYQRDQDVVLALWSDKPTEVSVPVGAPVVELYDWMGNARSVEAPDNLLRVELSQEPGGFAGERCGAAGEFRAGGAGRCGRGSLPALLHPCGEWAAARRRGRHSDNSTASGGHASDTRLQQQPERGIINHRSSRYARGASVESSVARRWHEFAVAMRDEGARWVRRARIGSYDLRFAPCEEFDGDRLPCAVKRSGNVTSYELALPWKLLNADAPLKPGATVGVALWVRDLDLRDGERVGKAIGFFGGIVPVRDIPAYGWVVLQ